MRLHNVVYEREDLERNRAGRTPEERLRDDARDGVDAEVIFPNKGLTMWATPAPVFSNAMCRVWNEWAWETFGPYTTTGSRRWGRWRPEISRGPSWRFGASRSWASAGSRFHASPCGAGTTPRMRTTIFRSSIHSGRPSRRSTCRSPSTFRLDVIHVRRAVTAGPSSTTRCTRSLRPWNLSRISAPLACSSAFRSFASRPSRPALDGFPGRSRRWTRPTRSTTCGFGRSSGGCRASTFVSTASHRSRRTLLGLALARQHGLVPSFLWANDYPHHEGTWPHSAPAIERQMCALTDGERAKILGENGVRLFRFDPARLLQEGN